VNSVPVQPPPLPAAPQPPAVLSPMVLSALVCPGAGQLMQRRWLVGTIFIASFTVAFLWFMVEAMAVLKAYYAFAFDFRGATGRAPGAAAILRPFLISLAIYVAGLIDTAVGTYRQMSRNRKG